MSDKGGGLAIGGTTNSCVGESQIIPNDQCNQTMPSYMDSERLIGDAAKIPDNTVFDARKQEEDEEAKQLLVDMIVNETMKNTTFMESLRKTKVDTAWDEKRKQEKEELKKKRDEMKKKKEEQQKKKQYKAMGKKNKK